MCFPASAAAMAMGACRWLGVNRATEVASLFSRQRRKEAWDGTPNSRARGRDFSASGSQTAAIFRQGSLSSRSAMCRPKLPHPAIAIDKVFMTLM